MAAKVRAGRETMLRAPSPKPRSSRRRVALRSLKSAPPGVGERGFSEGVFKVALPQPAQRVLEPSGGWKRKLAGDPLPGAFESE